MKMKIRPEDKRDIPLGEAIILIGQEKRTKIGLPTGKISVIRAKENI
jgi:hypothetical protein